MNIPSRLLLAMLIAGPAAIVHAQAEPAQGEASDNADAQAPDGDAGPGAHETRGANADSADSPDRRDEAVQRRTANADSVGGDVLVPPEAGPLVYALLGTYCPGTEGRIGSEAITSIAETYNPDHTFTVTYGPELEGRFPRITGGHWEYHFHFFDSGGWHVFVDLRTDQYPPMRIDFHMWHDEIFATDYFHPGHDIPQCNQPEIQPGQPG